jgi:hypothetical protein
MGARRYDEAGLKAVEHLLGYYDWQVLAAYRAQPQRYLIKSDNFEGELQTTDEYYRELEMAGKAGEAIRVRFGYRSLLSGDLAIVAWLPDLFRNSKAHFQQWSGFHLGAPAWTMDYDERFDKWVRRYIEGSWEVDSGPLRYLEHTIHVVNSLTIELVGLPLFKHPMDENMEYPAADNTHRYEDSHERLYGYLVDGLDKQCILSLASRLQKELKVGDKKTVEAITALFPSLKTSQHFMPAISCVSKQRRLASHGARLPAKHFTAFSQFTKDLFLCLEATKELLAILESEFGVNGEEMHDHHSAKNLLPEIDAPADPHYSIAQASRMVDKTIEKVEVGSRKKIKGVHESEALIIHFTDGSIMGLDTGSNAGNLATDANNLSPDDFRVDFVVRWVPELTKRLRESQS